MRLIVFDFYFELKHSSVIKRLMTLLSLCAHHMAESAAAQKQAKGASQYAEMLMAEGEKV